MRSGDNLSAEADVSQLPDIECRVNKFALRADFVAIVRRMQRFCSCES
jgi:hypothetical protein